VGDSGVGDAADRIDFGDGFPVFLRHACAVAVAGGFGVDALVVAGGVAVVDPEEGADFRGVAGGLFLDDACFRKFDDFAGAEFVLEAVIEIGQRGRLHGDGEGAGLFADHHRRAPEPVAGGVDLAVDQDEDRAGTVDLPLRVADSFDERILAADQHGGDFGRVELAVARFREVAESAVERRPGQLFEVVDLPDGDDGEGAELAGDDERLVLVVADDADSGTAAELVDIVVEFGAELRVGDVVNPPGDAPFAVADGQAAPFGPEMGVVVRSVEEVAHAVMVCDDAEKSAHGCSPSLAGTPEHHRALRSSPFGLIPLISGRSTLGWTPPDRSPPIRPIMYRPNRVSSIRRKKRGPEILKKWNPPAILSNLSIAINGRVAWLWNDSISPYSGPDRPESVLQFRPREVAPGLCWSRKTAASGARFPARASPFPGCSTPGGGR